MHYRFLLPTHAGFGQYRRRDESGDGLQDVAERWPVWNSAMHIMKLTYSVRVFFDKHVVSGPSTKVYDGKKEARLVERTNALT